jgi:predicted transcriptional regulator of viral defense system
VPALPPPPSQRPLRAHEYVDRLALAGRYHFTTEEAAEALGLSEIAARAAIRRLKRRNTVAAPVRGFHVLVSPEHRAAGCPPAAEFLPELMAFVDAPYYVGLLSAAAYYGAADRLDTVQVVTDKNRPPVSCGHVHVDFVARRAAAEVPTRSFPTNRGRVAVSTPEATAIDLAAYPQHAGDLDDVALVLAGLAPNIDGETLAGLASSIAEMPWVQRLGFLLDRAGAESVTGPLARTVAEAMPPATPLDPKLPWTGAPRDAKWRLALNRPKIS